MAERQSAKNSLKFNLNHLKNSLVNNLHCKDDDIKLDVKYSDDKYSAIFSIDFLDEKRKSSYKTFEIKGGYFPEITKFEYNGENIGFLEQRKLIDKIQISLNNLNASWKK